MFSYDTRPYLAASSPFVRVSQKPDADTDNARAEGRTNISARDSSKWGNHSEGIGPDAVVPSLRNSVINLLPSHKGSSRVDTKGEQELDFLEDDRATFTKTFRQTPLEAPKGKNEH